MRDAAAKGLQAGETFYTWQRGIPELRAALSAYTERLYGIKCPVDRISVTTGGMQAILLCCQLLLDPGDNIVIVSPIWPNITSAARLVRGEPKYVALDREPDGGWKLDLQKVFDAVDARTRAIFVNSPGNPTGWTMTLRRAARAARLREEARPLDHGRRGLCAPDLHAAGGAVLPRACADRTIR